ncbi:CMP-N-acetylneuraminate-beta-galactosamide-alpha-2,3-sialyltransferase 1-like [Sphaeramia orbicularis]|uniref:CMP-N-acetylneuraminate-beta-galactosamide-alpha-2,3-sialyltransferase 1 n=1 Tax=Sphaeramia orbicularis TaxID=375764 RepID=A0A673AJ85_9TELE|nr:CMP-N-acetylneuraminate-beta-galactosamide-alpha-2,3-sialyltransferase 1-like [Sphaeramia orbicularis]
MSTKNNILTFLLLLTGICLIWMETRPEFSFSLLNFRSCDCDTLTSTDVDPWFITHFNRSVEPFMSTKNNISERHFNWWKKLQYDRRNYAYYKATVEKLFQLLPSPPDEPSSGRCRTCSVVGNSGNLNDAHYGPLIDHQDLVIRINKGQTEGYEQHVGTRTTHRVMYPESASNISSNDTHIVLFPFKTKDLEWIIKATKTGLIGRQHSTKKGLVMVVNPSFMKYVHEIWLGKKGKYPSTGFMTLVLAIHLCEEVHVFGYGADSDGNWSHYWEELLNKKLRTGNHSGKHEYGIILKLAQSQKVKFYTGY